MRFEKKLVYDDTDWRENAILTRLKYDIKHHFVSFKKMYSCPKQKTLLHHERNYWDDYALVELEFRFNICHMDVIS